MPNNDSWMEYLDPNSFEKIVRYRCDRCGVVCEGAGHTFEGLRVCTSCYENLPRCPDCGVYVGGGMNLSLEGSCDSCDQRSMQGYSYKGEIQFFDIKGETTNGKFFGVEVEVDATEESMRYKRWQATRPINQMPEINGITRDASLNYGFEITTQPLSFGYHMSTDFWDNVVDIVKSNGWKALTTCGIHVHISKEAFKSSMHKMKFVYFFNNQRKLVENFSGRTTNRYALIKPKETLLDCVHTDKHDVVATCLDYTYEVRAFKGAVNPKTIRANIQFVESVFEFSLKIKVSDMMLRSKALLEYYKFLIENKDKYNILLQRLRIRGLLTHEHCNGDAPLEQCCMCGSVIMDYANGQPEMCIECYNALDYHGALS